MGLTVGLVLVGLYAWHQRGAGPGERRGAPAPVVVSSADVTEETWTPAIQAVGSAVPTQGVVVSAEVAGQVREIFFDTGQHVAAGDPIVQLDDEVDKAELESLLADKTLAALTLERSRRLASENLASRSNLDEAQARLESAAALVETKRARIRKKTIRAPFAGELGIRRVSPGRYVAAGEEIVTLVALDPIFVEYTLPERYLGELTPGQTVEVSVQAYPDRVFSGRLHAISPGVDEGTRSVRVRALFENADGHLRPGMFAEVRTLKADRRRVLTLPEQAITYAPYGSSVFVIEDGGDGASVVRRQVTTGETRDGRVEIVKGLSAGERVVSAGQGKLRNGQPVSIDNSVRLDAPTAGR